MIEGLGKSALHWQIHFEFVLYFKERKYNDLQVQNHASTSSHIHEYVENSTVFVQYSVFLVKTEVQTFRFTSSERITAIFIALFSEAQN